MTAPSQSSDIVQFAADVLGVELYPGQAAALREYYTSGRPNWLLLSGRRGGKSLLSDIIACYEAVVPDFGVNLRPGEERYLLVVSVRLDNAQLHIRNTRRLLRHTRSIGKMIKSEGRDRIELTNGAIILSLPASARAGRGFTASTLIFDELAHFIDSDGNASGDAVFDAFSPTVATFGASARIVITTTPAARSGLVYDLFDRALPDWYITQQPTTALNPKVSQKVIDRAVARDAESAQVEYFAEFAEPISAFLDSSKIDAAINPARERQDYGLPGVAYSMAIDPATMSDRYAFTICHREGERIVLDYAQIMRPAAPLLAKAQMWYPKIALNVRVLTNIYGFAPQLRL